MSEERTPEEEEKVRQELLAKYADLHKRAVELKERMDTHAGARSGPKPLRIVLMVGGLVGLPTAGYFLLGGIGVGAGVVLYIIAMWIALRVHESGQRAKNPQLYEKGKGYIQ